MWISKKKWKKSNDTINNNEFEIERLRKRIKPIEDDILYNTNRIMYNFSTQEKKCNLTSSEFNLLLSYLKLKMTDIPSIVKIIKEKKS